MLMEAISDIQKLIKRIKAWVHYLGLSKNQLAHNAGLTESTLRDFHRPGWNPTSITLEKLEAAIPIGLPPEKSKTDTPDIINKN